MLNTNAELGGRPISRGFRVYLRLRPLILAVNAFGIVGRIILAVSSQGTLNTLGFFTVQSNLFVLAFLALSVPRGMRARDLQDLPGVAPRWIHGAIALAIAITGIVYYALLARTVEAAGLNALFLQINHGVTPTLFLIDWFITGSRQQYTRRDFGMWFIYPVAYAVFGTIEGALGRPFRYFFLNYRQPTGNYLLWLGVVVLLFFVVAGVLLLLNRIPRAERQKAQPGPA